MFHQRFFEIFLSLDENLGFVEEFSKWVHLEMYSGLDIVGNDDVVLILIVLVQQKEIMK